jgi:hypothetical protein
MKKKNKSFKKYLKSFERSPYYYLILNLNDNKKDLDEKDDDEYEKTAQLRYIQNATARN